jgi:hypothetical protein
MFRLLACRSPSSNIQLARCPSSRIAVDEVLAAVPGCSHHRLRRCPFLSEEADYDVGHDDDELVEDTAAPASDRKPSSPTIERVAAQRRVAPPSSLRSYSQSLRTSGGLYVGTTRGLALVNYKY